MTVALRRNERSTLPTWRFTTRNAVAETALDRQSLRTRTMASQQRSRARRREAHFGRFFSRAPSRAIIAALDSRVPLHNVLVSRRRRIRARAQAVAPVATRMSRPRLG